MKDSKPLEETATAFDGRSIHVRRWETDKERKGILIIVHGLGEHGGRYGETASLLNELGVTVVAGDLRGHGRSEGKRGHIMNFGEFTEDVHMLVNEFGDGERIFLLGHSMGGLISFRYACDHPEHLSGLILSSPLLGLRLEPPPWKEILGRIVSRLVPAFSMGNEIDPNLLSHDEEEVAGYVKDPLVHDRVSARLFTEMVRMMDIVAVDRVNLTLPVLFLVAGGDEIVSPAHAKKTFEEIGSEDREYREYDGLYHEVLNEVDRERVLLDLEKWMLARLSP